MKIRKNNIVNFSITAAGHNVIRLVNNAFAYKIHDARIQVLPELKLNKTNSLGPFLLY